MGNDGINQKCNDIRNDSIRIRKICSSNHMNNAIKQ